MIHGMRHYISICRSPCRATLLPGLGQPLAREFESHAADKSFIYWVEQFHWLLVAGRRSPVTRGARQEVKGCTTDEA